MVTIYLWTTALTKHAWIVGSLTIEERASCKKYYLSLNSYIIYQDIGFKMGFSDTFKQLMEKYIRSLVWLCMTTEGSFHRNGLSKHHICFSIEYEHKIQRNLVNLIRIKWNYWKLMIYLFLTCQHWFYLSRLFLCTCHCLIHTSFFKRF